MRRSKPKSAAKQLALGDPQKLGVHKLEERLAREAKARTGLPECPAHLDGSAREAWEFFSVELMHMDVDKRPDAKSLEALCCAYATARATDEAIRRDGVMVDDIRTTSKGETVNLGKKPNPALTMNFRAWKLFHTYATEFGFTPASRTRLMVDSTTKGTTQDIADILGSPRPEREVKSTVQ